ncbi:hypothetical protein ACRAKI_12355 [Saccharothrix isguenensis]
MINAKTTAFGPRAPSVRTTNRTERISQAQKRSNRYLDAVRALDSGGRLGTAEVRDLVDGIRREFEAQYCSTPIGIVGRCYLGDPFEVHTLALDGAIIEHYRTGVAVPGGLERARPLAISPVYLAIEVYTDRMVCVRADGTTAVLEEEA